MMLDLFNDHFYSNPIFWALLFVLIPFVLFAVTYAGQPWRTTAPGRSIMYLACSIVAILSQGVVNLALPDYAGKDVLRVFLLAGVSVAGWYLYGALLQINRKARENEETPPNRRSGVDRRRPVE